MMMLEAVAVKRRGKADREAARNLMMVEGERVIEMWHHQMEDYICASSCWTIMIGW
jgi:hypothetical protein